jgi:hypothetical protein
MNATNTFNLNSNPDAMSAAVLAITATSGRAYSESALRKIVMSKLVAATPKKRASKKLETEIGATVQKLVASGALKSADGNRIAFHLLPEAKRETKPAPKSDPKPEAKPRKVGGTKAGIRPSKPGPMQECWDLIAKLHAKGLDRAAIREKVLAQGFNPGSAKNLIGRYLRTHSN